MGWKMRKLILIILSVLLLAAMGPSHAQPTATAQDRNGNLELHVVTDEDVDIKVYIDDKLVVDRQFKKAQNNFGVMGIAPHKAFQLDLKPGKHVIRAEAHQGAQHFTSEVELAGSKRRVALYYANPDGNRQKEPFSLEAYDHQIAYQ